MMYIFHLGKKVSTAIDYDRASEWVAREVLSTHHTWADYEIVPREDVV